MSTRTWVNYSAIISNMSKKLSVILSENFGSLFGEAGRFTSNAAAESKTGVPRSTFDRLRNANKPGTPVVGVDKLEDIAKSLKIEPWQLIYPGLDIDNPPTVKESPLLKKHIKLVAEFDKLGPEEQEYIFKKIKALLDDGESKIDPAESSKKILRKLGANMDESLISTAEVIKRKKKQTINKD